jgi:hypothetical protein
MPDPAPDRFACPWLGREVELPGERELQIEEQHPDLLPRHRTALAEVLADPDLVRRGALAAPALLFSRAGTVVVVAPGPTRCCILTAYRTRTIAGGEVLWRRG